MAAAPRVSLKDATVRYGDRTALSHVSAELYGGSTVALVGPNGSGKTTLLHLVAGLLHATEGSVDRRGNPSVALVAQHHSQHEWMPLTVTEVLTMGRFRERGLLRRLRSEDREETLLAAERLDVADLRRRNFGTLSGGQRQRVLVAGALTTDADVLLLDEPITGLDLPSQHAIFGVIDEEREKGRLVLLSTHDLDEARRCDRVILLRTKIVADGTPDEVFTTDNLTAAFGHHVLAGTGARPVVLDDHGHGSEHRDS